MGNFGELTLIGASMRRLRELWSMESKAGNKISSLYAKPKPEVLLYRLRTIKYEVINPLLSKIKKL